MSSAKRPCIFLTTEDADRLKRIFPAGAPGPNDGAALLREELARAQICPPDEMPARIVRLGSRVRYQDLDTGRELEVRLVLPGDEQGPGRLSVLSADGAALIGVPEDQVFRWEDEAGRPRAVKVLQVLDDFIWR